MCKSYDVYQQMNFVQENRNKNKKKKYVKWLKANNLLFIACGFEPHLFMDNVIKFTIHIRVHKK